MCCILLSLEKLQMQARTLLLSHKIDYRINSPAVELRVRPLVNQR